MPVQDLGDWLEEQADGATFLWAKRLSANDTQANGSHQAGLLVPNQTMFQFLPELNNPQIHNPKIEFDVAIDSHADFRTVMATWYNNKVTLGKTRDETRITNWGGASSPLLDPESTGALTVFAFGEVSGSNSPRCRVWVCDYAIEEDLVIELMGPVEPGMPRTWSKDGSRIAGRSDCVLSADELPSEWLEKYPSGQALLSKVLELRPGTFDDVDRRLTTRWDCQHRLSDSLEEAVELPRVKQGYETMGEFRQHAQSVLQRRRSRAGGALELNVRQILLEEQFVEGIHFDYKQRSEERREPDFLFPSAGVYHDSDFRSDRLRMLAVKTTLRDRWRQIIQEAARIPQKHVLTLQPGVSENQFKEIQEANLSLVVPKSLHDRYSPSIRPHLQTLESFLGDLRLLR